MTRSASPGILSSVTLLVVAAVWLFSAGLLAVLLGAVFRGARQGETQVEVQYGTVVPLPRVGDRESVDVR